MGSKKETQAIILIVLLAITGFLVYRTADSLPVTKSRDLKTVFGPVAGYEISYRSPLEEQVYRFLDLDDYTSIGYEKDHAPVGLYIGYYFTPDKVPAAHSPLVCFPGQGWIIDQPVMRRLEVGGHTIHYAEMVARLDDRKELILYWYQAGESTAPEVYKNKMNAMINKFTGKSQEHAFVRVSVPFNNITIEQARVTGQSFIEAFYPMFLSYINDKSSPARN
ncbi:MAG: EpsI family protein [Desulfobulbus sp.]|nr:EpsI family protein [Desulfobulbus sp.]